MRRDYTTLKPQAFRRAELVQCSYLAGIMYQEAWLNADNFGRLDGTPLNLASDLVPLYVLGGKATVDDVTAARDELVRAGLWYRYAVGGREYVEILDYDQGVSASWLPKRGGPDYPDPPDRPDLAAAERTRYQSKRSSKQTTEKEPPRGNADLPAGTATGMPTLGAERGAVPAGSSSEATGMPTPGASQGAVPGRAATADANAPVRQTAEYREYEQVCRDNGMEQWTRETPFMQLYRAAISKDGRSWAILVEVAREAALSASRTPGPKYGLEIIQNLPPDVLTRAQVRAHFETARQGGRQPPAGQASPEPESPDEEDNSIATRVRRQTEQLRQAHATPATA